MSFTLAMNLMSLKLNSKRHIFEAPKFPKLREKHETINQKLIKKNHKIRLFPDLCISIFFTTYFAALILY